MSARRDIEAWQKFALAVLLSCLGFYLAVWGPTAEARGLGGTILGTILAVLIGGRGGNGNGSGNGKHGGGTGGGGKSKWKPLTLRSMQVALVAFCGGLAGWYPLVMAADVRYPVALGVGALVGCAALAIDGKRVRGVR